MTNNKDIEQGEFHPAKEVWLGLFRRLKRAFQFSNKGQPPTAIVVPDIPEVDGVRIRYLTCDREGAMLQGEIKALEAEIEALNKTNEMGKAVNKELEDTIKSLSQTIDELSKEVDSG